MARGSTFVFLPLNWSFKYVCTSTIVLCFCFKFENNDKLFHSNDDFNRNSFNAAQSLFNILFERLKIWVNNVVRVPNLRVSYLIMMLKNKFYTLKHFLDCFFVCRQKWLSKLISIPNYGSFGFLCYIIYSIGRSSNNLIKISYFGILPFDFSKTIFLNISNKTTTIFNTYINHKQVKKNICGLFKKSFLCTDWLKLNVSGMIFLIIKHTHFRNIFPFFLLNFLAF